jgi:hypothetical protein
MLVLLHVAISICEPFEVVSLIAIGELEVFGAFKVVENVLHHFPMNVAQIFKKLLQETSHM